MNIISKLANPLIVGNKIKRVLISYDANSLKIKLFINEDDDQNLFFYIYGNWRFINDGKIINSSSMYPSDYLYESKEKHKIDFNKYCDSTKFLEKVKILQVESNIETNDFTIKWDNNVLLEVFCIDPVESYILYDNLNKVEYKIGYGNITKCKY